MVRIIFMRIWFVAQAFPPSETIGVERAKKFVRHWAGRGHHVTVFTVKNGVTPRAERFCGAFVRRSATIFPDLFASNASRYREVARFLSRVLTAVLGDFGWNWVLGLSRDLQAELAANGRPDVVIATGRPFLTFKTVARFSRKHGIPFVLDYRDAWSENPHATYDNPLRRTLTRWLERRVNSEASAVVTVSRLTANVLLGARNPLVIYNLPDLAYAKELQELARGVGPLVGDRLTFGYGGMLYPGRDFEPLCAAISRLTPAERAEVEVHYCGSSGARARASFRSHGIEEVLVDHGPLSKPAAVSLIVSCDVALSVIASRDEPGNQALYGVITTKIFDYLVLGKEVLNIVPPGFEFTALAKSLGVSGLNDADPCAIASITEYIRVRSRAKRRADVCHQSPESGDPNKLIRAWGAQVARFDLLLERVVK